MRDEYAFSKAKRGPMVKVPAGKTRITIRIDDDLLAWFKEQVHNAGGGNYQALREYVAHNHKPFEATLRRGLREELRDAG